MTIFTVTREVRAPAIEVWGLLVDWPRHGAWVPLTTMRVGADRGAEVGATFVGRTAIGPVGFDDVMRVLSWRAPTDDATGRVRIRHEGNVVGGEAELEVRPVTATRCSVTWWEDVHLLPGLPPRAAQLVALLGGPANVLAGRLIFGRVLRLVAAQAEQAQDIAEQVRS